MKKTIHKKIIILGSGPAGYTAAIYAARANLSPCLITGNNLGGQLMNTNEIENWPGKINNISGAQLMKNMHNHALKFDTKILSDHIIEVQFLKKPFHLLGENYFYTADAIIIATGAHPKYLNISSEKLYKGKGVSTCAVCDGFFYKDKEVAVVGGGNTAIEETLYLSNFVKKIHLIHRREYFTAEKILITRLMKKVQENKVILYLNSTIQKILGDTKSISSILINQNIMLQKKEKTIMIEGLFIAIGYTPNTKIFLNQLKMKNGYILIKKSIHGYHTETSVPGIFAAGDVIDHVYRQAITSAASGCMAAIDSERYLNSILI